MKAFYTPEHIAPIMDEIRRTWKPTGSKAAREYLHCEALLQKRGGRDFMAIRIPERGGFYYTGPAARQLIKELAEWTKAAETEPGELDRWLYQEEQRIMEAIRAALIDEYSDKGPARID